MSQTLWHWGNTQRIFPEYRVPTGYYSRYENYLLLGNSNSELSENAIIEFCKVYKLKSLVKSETSYKNPDRLSCIALILTNRPRSFQRCHIVETGLSHFHKMTTTIMKMYFKKEGPRVIQHRDYKRFDKQSSCQDVFASLHEKMLI